MNKLYLVTGGSGFIGSALLRKMIKAGYNIRCLDDFSRGSERRINDILPHIESIHGDVRDAGAVINAAKGVDGIIHLAYINGTEFFYKKPALVLDVAVRGIVNVLDACQKNDISELILASSSEVYQTPDEIPSSESVPLIVPDVMNPRYSYGGGKIISELMAINYAREKLSKLLIFRPHNVYGPDMGWEHVLPQFILRAKKLAEQTEGSRLVFPIQGSGEETRAFIHIDDFTDGVMTVIEKGEHLNIYHIGNPEELSIREVARSVVKYFGKEPEIIAGALQEGSTLRRCPNIDKLRALGFEPNINFSQGLPSIADWYINNSELCPNPT